MKVNTCSHTETASPFLRPLIRGRDGGSEAGRVPGASHVWESKQACVFDGREIRTGGTFYAAALTLLPSRSAAVLYSAARRPAA